MPSSTRLSTPIAVDEPAIEGRYSQVGDYTVAFETYRLDVDPAPLFAGLPDDRCQCPHWGVVTEGQITFRWPDHDETFMAGDAYYAPPGHLPLITAGAAVVEFSPTSAGGAGPPARRRNGLGSPYARRSTPRSSGSSRSTPVWDAIWPPRSTPAAAVSINPIPTTARSGHWTGRGPRNSPESPLRFTAAGRYPGTRCGTFGPGRARRPTRRIGPCAGTQIGRPPEPS